MTTNRKQTYIFLAQLLSGYPCYLISKQRIYLERDHNWGYQV